MEAATLYQFRYYIKGISPLILRRLQLNHNNTLADFHHAIQMTLGWTNYHLHQFNIRGKTYGICPAYVYYTEDAALVTIDSLNLHKNEKFTYEYNFNSGWRLEIRLEDILQVDKNKIYPLCISGKRAGPPEDCGGPMDYMELDDYYSEYQIIEILTNKFNEIKQEGEDISELRETLSDLEFWVNKNKFNRKEVNFLLKKFATKAPDWEDYMCEVIQL